MFRKNLNTSLNEEKQHTLEILGMGECFCFLNCCLLLFLKENISWQYSEIRKILGLKTLPVFLK